jgi:hypothetical protein
MPTLYPSFAKGGKGGFSTGLTKIPLNPPLEKGDFETHFAISNVHNRLGVVKSHLYLGPPLEKGGKSIVHYAPLYKG